MSRIFKTPTIYQFKIDFKDFFFGTNVCFFNTVKDLTFYSTTRGKKSGIEPLMLNLLHSDKEGV